MCVCVLDGAFLSDFAARSCGSYRVKLRLHASRAPALGPKGGVAFVPIVVEGPKGVRFC